MQIRDPESFCPWIRDPGRKKSDPGSGINIPDAPHFIELSEFGIFLFGIQFQIK
jgi:hypothetical protein